MNRQKMSKGGTNLSGKKFVVFTVALFFAFALCSVNAWCADDFINASQGYGGGAWYTSIYGNLNDGINQMSLRGDLGLKNATGYNADLNWNFGNKWGADVNITGMKAKQTNFIATRSYNFKGQAVNQGDLTTSHLNFTDATFALRYNLVSSQDGYLGVQLAPKWISLDANVATTTKQVYSQTKNLVVPTIGLSGKQRMSDNLYINADFQGMKYNNNRVIDFRADFRWRFQHPGWYFTLGYRVFDTKFDLDNGTTGTINWNGPVATLRYEF